MADDSSMRCTVRRGRTEMDHIQNTQSRENKVLFAALKTIAGGDKIGRRIGEVLIGMGLAEFSKFGVKLTNRGYGALDELEEYNSLTGKHSPDTCVALRT